MVAVTSQYGPKPFTWSYSRLKNFEACPKKHYETDIAKSVPFETSEQLTYGNEVHAAFHERLGAKRTPFPKGMEQLEHWAERVLTGPGTIHVENKMGITREFADTGYFAGNVWFRAIGDAIKVNNKVGWILDWKTGKIVEDSVQLALCAACVFAKFPEVQRVKSTYAWLAHNATTDEIFSRDDMPAMWRNIWPRIQRLEHAHNTTSYPAVPNGLCRSWCGVKSCVHHGVGG
jgi:hypothetical protein